MRVNRFWAALAAIVLGASQLPAQGVVQQIGPVTSGHIAAWWMNGQIYDGGSIPLPNTTNSWTAKQTFGPGTTNSAPIGILPGVAPISPMNGDIWTTATDILTRLNGSTITVTQPSAGAVLFSQTGSYPQGTAGLSLQGFVSVKDAPYNAKCDGVTDDTAALQAAFAVSGREVHLPAGTCLYNSNLAPASSAIVGEGELVSILKPGPAVTTALGIGNSATQYLQGFQIDGSLTSSATGLYLGNAASVAVNLQSVRVKNFLGASGVGVRVDQLLKSTLVKLTSESNNTGLLIQQASPGSFPTTTAFIGAVFTGNTTYGAKIVDSSGQVIFFNTDFESSGNEGLYIATSSGRDVIDVFVKNSWFESNNGNDNTKYHITVGTNSGSRTIRFVSEDTHFDSAGAGKSRAINLNGSEVESFTISNPRLNSDATVGAITIQNGAKGSLEQWPSYLSYTNAVSDASSNDYGPYGAWHTYTPTFATNSGNAATSFAVGPTMASCKYKQIGKSLFVAFDIAATLKAVTPNNITMTIPILAGTPTVRELNWTTAIVFDAGTPSVGQVFADNTNGTINIRKIDSSNFTSAGAIVWRGEIKIELQ